LQLFVLHQAFLFDLRRPEVVLKQPDAIVSQNSDEINRIVIHPKGDYIAACDDSGEVKLFEPIRHSLVRTLRSKHTNLCTSLAFRPKSGHQIVSGGMDCQVVIWDTSNGRAQHSFSTNDASSGSGVNPPFVHSLDMAVSGDECAFGLGNADVLLYSLKNRSEIKRLRGHTSPVAVVYDFF
jgi:WD40 repeat protein